jgi:hypothetical protein
LEAATRRSWPSRKTASGRCSITSISNPVRADIVAERDGLESYAWSSLPHYLGPSRKRPLWLETATGFAVCGCDNTPVDAGSFSACWSSGWTGTTFPEGDGKPQLAVYSSLRRGWFFGSEHFREELLKMLAKRPRELRRPTAITDHSLATTQKNGPLRSFERPWSTLASIWRPCAGLAREIGAKGCLRR